MKFAIICCSGKPLAVLHVRHYASGYRVRIETRAHAPHIRVVANPVVDGQAAWDADELAARTHQDVVEHNVTEIQWVGHRSWVIRCGAECPTNQEAQISADNLPKIAEKLSRGNWLEEYDGMPVVPLGVLNFLTDPRNW